MCVVSFRIDEQADFPFVFIGNRDEFYQRPSQAIHRWPDAPHIYAGRDCEQWGTWLGLTDQGYFATILNDPGRPEDIIDQPKSRGNLVRDYLSQPSDVDEYLAILRDHRQDYLGYFLIFGQLDRLYFYSNVRDQVSVLGQGLHVFSNTEDDMSNFRTYQAEKILNQQLKLEGHPGLNHLNCITAFHNTQRHPHFKTHPDRFSFERAYHASSLFIEDDQFGTVGTTVISVDRQGQVKMTERRYLPQGFRDHHQLSFQTQVERYPL